MNRAVEVAKIDTQLWLRFPTHPLTGGAEAAAEVPAGGPGGLVKVHVTHGLLALRLAFGLGLSVHSNYMYLTG